MTKGKKAKKIVLRCLIVFGVTLLFVVATLYGAMWIVVKGPSPELKRLFVLSVKETSAAGFLADMYLSEDEINEITGAKHTDTDEQIDTSLIKINIEEQHIKSVGEDETEKNGEDKTNGIEILDVNGSTYMGRMMIVKDPSRVFVGVPDKFGASESGLSLKNMIKKYDAVAGINGGGFYDPNGVGTGGIPDGIVIKEGKLLWGSDDTVSTVIGFDSSHILHVGRMSGKAALDQGIVEALSFGPALIVNGKAQNETYKLGGGVNPRTVIGQRSDGAVLLLVIDGRSVSSLGVTYDDLVDIMLSYGAVNAANLDGGSSTLMVYEGKSINTSAYIFGERVLATSFLVK